MKIEQEYTLYNGSKLEIVSGAVARVQMLSITTPLQGTLVCAAAGYTGRYSTTPPDNISEVLENILKTKLQTPLEMVHVTWLIQNVTRAWTHQAVRTRIGVAYVQESMRFLGLQDSYRVLVTGDVAKDDFLLRKYGEAAFQALSEYVREIKLGAASQDARGILPTNILTQMFWDMSLSTLVNIIRQRLCCQAQQEWISVVRQMRNILIEQHPFLKPFLLAPVEKGEDCGYHASWDRPCIWKQRIPDDKENDN